MTRQYIVGLTVMCLNLVGCGDRDLHLTLHFRDAGGLVAGAPVVFNNRTIGSVLTVEDAPQGGSLAGIAVARKFAAAATTDSRFYLNDMPGASGQKRIEIEQTTPGGRVLADGAVIEGSDRSAGLLPFGEIFRQFSDGLRGMREQVQQFQRDLRKLPDSDEGKRLQQEWRRLTEEIDKAQKQTDESVKNELLPKLEAEMERLREGFKKMVPTSPGSGKPQQNY